MEIVFDVFQYIEKVIIDEISFLFIIEGYENMILILEGFVVQKCLILFNLLEKG